MLVITGIFEDGRFIPDEPVSIPEGKKVTVTIEDEKPKITKRQVLTMAQIDEWSKSPEIQSLAGVLKNSNLSPDITLSDIKNERLKEKYGA